MPYLPVKRFHQYARQRGQAMVEYAVIAAAVILAFAAALALTQQLLVMNVSSTMAGFSSPSLMP